MDNRKVTQECVIATPLLPASPWNYKDGCKCNNYNSIGADVATARALADLDQSRTSFEIISRLGSSLDGKSKLPWKLSTERGKARRAGFGLLARSNAKSRSPWRVAISVFRDRRNPAADSSDTSDLFRRHVPPPPPRARTPAAGKRAFNVRVVFEPKSVWG